jgi:hypothetical protein
MHPLHETAADLSEALALLRSRFAPTAADQRSGHAPGFGDFNS